MNIDVNDRLKPDAGQTRGPEAETPAQPRRIGPPLLKNVDFGRALNLAELVACRPGQVVSRTLAQNYAVSVTLFAFGAGEEIGAHVSEGDALLTVLEGQARITIGGKAHSLDAGQSIAMPAGIPHAVAAEGDFKMLLTVVFP